MIFENHKTSEVEAKATITSENGHFICRECLVIDIAGDDIEIHSVNLTAKELEKVKRIIAEL